MSESSYSNKRLAKNTLFLYFRMLFVMVIGLYTSRVVLRTLGVEDFGIYNVVGSFVSMFSLISGALTAAVSRFLNIEMGRKDSTKLKDVFSTAINIHIILAVIILLVAEMIGPWFIRTQMTISLDKIDSAIYVFHFSLLTFLVNLISIPYNACIIAHEDMKIFAYISFVEVSLKLLIVYLLLLFSYDKLVLYGFFMLCTSLIIRCIYQIYCRKHYAESSFRFYMDKQIFREMFGFTGWNIIGSTSVILSNQGVNILLNVFGSPVVNAARGIAVQIEATINSFVQNFMTAMNPQITKSYGAGDLETYSKLMMYGGRFSVGLLTLLSLPFLVETHYILELWLGEVPEYTVNFARLILIFAISEAMSYTFTTGLLATDKIKKLQILVGGCRMMNLPISYVLLKLGMEPEITMVVAIVLSQVNLLLRLTLLKQYIQLSIKRFYRIIVLKQVISILLPLAIGIYLTKLLPMGLFRLAIMVFILIITELCCLLFINCNQRERFYIVDKLFMMIKKYDYKKHR